MYGVLVMQLWLELARAFLSDDSADDAQYCADRALLLSPGSAAAHHVQGCVQEVSSAMCAQRVMLLLAAVTQTDLLYRTVP